VDDFALRKGVKYGTILLNLERQCLVDLLPDREKATVATWLKSHPGVKMVSRDRGGAYAEAAREAAPDAIQIADRFHLSQNAGEMVVRIMRRNYDRVKELVDETPQSAQPLDQSLPFQRHEADKQVSQQRRMAVYEHVILLYEQGCSPTEIAAQLRMSRKRVREFLRVTTFSTCIQATFNQARSIQSVSQAARGTRMGVAIPYSSIVKCVVKATMDVVR
jgi:transposase